MFQLGGSVIRYNIYQIILKFVYTYCFTEYFSAFFCQKICRGLPSPFITSRIMRKPRNDFSTSMENSKLLLFCLSLSTIVCLWILEKACRHRNSKKTWEASWPQLTINCVVPLRCRARASTFPCPCSTLMEIYGRTVSSLLLYMVTVVLFLSLLLTKQLSSSMSSKPLSLSISFTLLTKPSGTILFVSAVLSVFPPQDQCHSHFVQLQYCNQCLGLTFSKYALVNAHLF